MKTTPLHFYELKAKTKNLSKKFQVKEISDDQVTYEYMPTVKKSVKKEKHWWDSLNARLNEVLQKDYETYCKSQEMF